MNILRRTIASPFLLTGIFIAVASMGSTAQAAPPPVVQSVNNSADYSTTVAQGSLIAIFGSNMGPANLVEVTMFPLQNTLAGTSVTVTSGSTTLNCPMIYTSAGQLAAILPSNTPLGSVSVTVAYNGQTGPFSTTQATVVASSVGMYTTTSTGLGAGAFNALDGTPKTLAVSAKPGETVYAWGTGLGPISTPDNVLPTSFPNFPGVQVWVGGQAAQIVYDGRSGCCSGLDQLAFTVPAVADGCNVPVTVVVGTSASNTVTIPVSAAGGACNDNGPTLPTSVLTKAAAKQPVKVAAISVGPARILGSASEPQSLARRLSAAFHTPVSEADAAKLLRAYSSRSQTALRKAIAPYAAEWRALDSRTKAALLAQTGVSADSAFAEFGSFSGEAVAANVASAQFPPAGGCVILPNGFPFGLGSVSAGLDAGASVALTGAGGSKTLNKVSGGQYRASFGTSVAGPNVPLGAYTISGSGGKDVGAFSATVNLVSHPAISNKSALATSDLTKPLTVMWTGGVAGSYVLIGGGLTSSPHGYFACVEDGGKGTFTIPTFILSSINLMNSSSGIIFITPHPLSNQITIPGVDLAYLTDASNDSVNVAFSRTAGPGTTNAANITGSIDGLYPASGAAAEGGASASGPLATSALLTAGTFTTTFDVRPGASPFTVVARAPGGSATVAINPAMGTWQATYTEPTVAAKQWNFSGDNFVVQNFQGGGVFPNNQVPFSLVDPIALTASFSLPAPNVATPAGNANGTWSASGALPAGGHFSLEDVGLATFGGFTNLTTRGAQSVTFSLSVDGMVIASKQFSITTD